MADSLLPGRLTCPTPLIYTQVQYQRVTGGSYVENPERLTPDLEEFEFPVQQELSALTKSGKTLGFRSSTQWNPNPVPHISGTSGPVFECRPA
jgi:hypothetical protein